MTSRSSIAAIERDEQSLAEKTGQLGVRDVLDAARDRLTGARKTLEELKHRHREAEAEVADLLSKIAAAEEQLYSGRIHNPKELTGLQQEVASAEKPLRPGGDRYARYHRPRRSGRAGRRRRRRRIRPPRRGVAVPAEAALQRYRAAQARPGRAGRGSGSRPPPRSSRPPSPCTKRSASRKSRPWPGSSRASARSAASRFPPANSSTPGAASPSSAVAAGVSFSSPEGLIGR